MREAVKAEGAPPAIGPYSQAVRIEGQVWISGQIGMTAAGEVVSGGVAAEARQAMENLKAILVAAGTGFDRVVKATIYLADMADFAVVNEVYGSYFGEAPPARACVQVAGLPRGARVEIDAVAIS